MGTIHGSEHCCRAFLWRLTEVFFYTHLKGVFVSRLKELPHIRSTNPIESTFATVRLRTDKTRSAVSPDSILSLVFKLIQSAQKRWLRIRGFKHLGDVIEGIPFKDGIRLDPNAQTVDPQKAA